MAFIRKCAASRLAHPDGVVDQSSDLTRKYHATGRDAISESAGGGHPCRAGNRLPQPLANTVLPESLSAMVGSSAVITGEMKRWVARG